MSKKRPPGFPPALAIAALGVDLGTGEVPVDVRLIPAGEFRSWDGRPTECPHWVCTDADGQRLVAEATARTSARVIDYEHATLLAKQSGSKAPAAGWFKALEWRPDDGLWAIGVDWTAQAAREIADKAYRFISPVFSYDATSGRVDRLLHAALTNDPGLDGLTDLAALAAELFFPPINPTEYSMDLLKKLLAALGLADTQSEAEALTALSALKNNVAALAAQVAKPPIPDPACFVPIATLSALQGEYAALQGRLAALSAEVNSGKLEKTIADGLSAGKLTPATEGWARELGQAKLGSLVAYLAAAPVVVAPGTTQSGGKVIAEGTAALSAIELEVCAAMAIPLDQYRKAAAA